MLIPFAYKLVALHSELAKIVDPAMVCKTEWEGKEQQEGLEFL